MVLPIFALLNSPPPGLAVLPAVPVAILAADLDNPLTALLVLAFISNALEAMSPLAAPACNKGLLAGENLSKLADCNPVIAV